MIDSHCHIQFKAFDDDREEVIKRCLEKQVILNVVGTQKNTSKKAVELTERYENIYATIGLHPIQEHKVKVKEEADDFTSRGEEFDEEFYQELVKSEKVIAIGETGLDKFHIPKDEGLDAVLEKQKQIFLQHYNFAKKHFLPLVIHVRDAHEEMIDLLQSILGKTSDGGKNGLGVIHCYSGNWQQAKQYLQMGLYLGFTGVLTFPSKKTDPQPQKDLIEVVENMPLNRILVETDAPYLAPQKYRGERSEPWMVEEVVKKIAEIKNLEVGEVQEVVVSNAKKLFSKIQ